MQKFNYHSPIDAALIYRWIVRVTFQLMVALTILAHFTHRQPEMMQQDIIGIFKVWVCAMFLIEVLSHIYRKAYFEEKYQSTAMFIAMSYCGIDDKASKSPSTTSALNIMTQFNTDDKTALRESQRQCALMASMGQFAMLVLAAATTGISLFLV